LFSAQYFSSILEAEVISHSHILLHLLASSAYYLSGYPGSSQVLLKNITDEQVDVLTQMEKILFVVLKRDHFFIAVEKDSFYVDTNNLMEAWNNFLIGKSSYEELDD
jgi:hypothetical protein